MKRYIFTTTFCLIYAVCFGQERVNRPKLSFINEGPILEQFIGWYYDDYTGEWMKQKNMIEDNRHMYNYSMTPFRMSLKNNNIISLQFKTVKYNDVLYYVLIWDKWEGAYKYPELYIDWEYWQTKWYLIFTEEDMDKLRHLTNEPVLIDCMRIIRQRYDTNVDDVVIIQNALIREHNLNIYFIIYKATTGYIRFLFEYLKNDISLIDKEYFEISEEKYLNLINIKKEDVSK